VLHNEGVEFYHGYTYSGHPACCAAAIANLTIIKREGLVERVRDQIGPYFQERWKALEDHPMVGQARMVGMFGALELVPDENDLKKRFDNVGKVGTITRDHSFANGLVMRAVRDSLIISPPLSITEEEIDVLIASARKTLDAAWNDVRRQGLA
jgi:putrescine aminotransferase